MTHLRLALLAALSLPLLAGCASRRGSVVQPTPGWETDQGRLDARIDLATVLVRGGSPDAGLQMITQLRGEGSKDPRLDLIQARALAAIGLAQDAELLLRDYVKKHPREADGHSQLGVMCLDTGRTDQAIEHLQRAAKLAPTDPDVLNNLGFAWLAVGRPDDAITTLRQALRYDSSSKQIRNNLGFALVSTGRDDDALRVFSAGLPAPDARFNLGLGLELRGDRDGAKIQYLRVLADWPAHGPAISGLKRLAASAPAMLPPGVQTANKPPVPSPTDPTPPAQAP